LLSGFSRIAFGFALLLSAQYPVWLGPMDILTGTGVSTAGVAQAHAVFSGAAMMVSMLASSVLLVWAILTGIFMWRSASR
jgi:hypothetical protein